MSVFDNTASIEGTGTSLSVSLTTAGTDRALAAGIGIGSNPIRTISSITYAGVDMGASRAENTNASYGRAALFVLADPTVGANNLAATINANGSWALGGVSATAVDQTTPVRTSSNVSATADATPATVDVGSATDDLVVDVVWAGTDSGVTTVSVGASQTQRWQQNQTYYAQAMSTEPGATTVTMSWAITGTNPNYVICAVSLQNVSGAATGRGPLIGGKLVGGILARAA